MYSFSYVGKDYALVRLEWERRAVEFRIDIDVKQVVLSSIKRELRNVKGYDWRGYESAASYCLNEGFNLDEALVWIDQSIDMNRNSENLFTKSQLLSKTNNQEESSKMLSEAIDIASVGERNSLGWQLWKNLEQPEKAVEVYLRNIKEADDWMAHYLISQVYDSMGENKKAIKYARLAVEKASTESGRVGASNILASLEKE